MSDLLDGSTVPWDFVSGRHDPAVKADPLVLERVRQRRAAVTELPAPVGRDDLDAAAQQLREDLQNPPGKRLVAGGLLVAGAVAAHWRRGRS